MGSVGGTKDPKVQAFLLSIMPEAALDIKEKWLALFMQNMRCSLQSDTSSETPVPSLDAGCPCPRQLLPATPLRHSRHCALLAKAR